MARPRVCACRGCEAHAGTCGWPATNERRCDRCGRPGFANRFRRTPDHPVRRTSAWRRLAKRTVEVHVVVHGWVCPGWHREPHPVRPGELAADHPVPLVLGGEPLHGLFAATVAGKEVVVDYEADSELRDTEQVPLLEPGGIDAFLEREVVPFAPGAWYDPSSLKTGYEISFTRYFYNPAPMRTLEEIRADILALEPETEGLLEQIVGGER